MKTTKTLAILVLALGLMVCPAELAGAATIGTAFTYQGRLVDDNSVANGLYDFQFKVFDNVIFGNQQGRTIYIYGLNVKDGNFTVELDFGSGIFTGDARWLEIGVRPGGSTDSFTILSPLQEIKPTPNSIHATHALQADEADTLNGFDSTAFASVAHSHDGVYDLIGHTHSGSDITTGTVADELIADSIARDSEITWDNLAGIPDGFADEIDDIGGTDSDWTISGNDMYPGAGVTGNVGIGTTGPSEKLDVNGNININSVYKIGGSTVLSVAGTQNTLVGVDAGANNTANYGTFVGYNAGYNNQGNHNTFSGNWAGYNNTDGNGNTFLGHMTGYYNTTGYENTFLGNSVGLCNTKGYSNTFLGNWAGYDNTTGNNNIFLGLTAGYNNTTGYRNTFLGNGAGHNNEAGMGNVFIGYNAGYNEFGSNKLYIDNSGTSTPLIHGNFSTNTVTINDDLDVTGGIIATTFVGDGSGLTGIITTETDPTVAASVKDGVSWSELSAIPGGFADDVDDVGLTVETDPQVGSNAINYVPKWYGSALESGTIYDNGTGNVGIGTTNPQSKLSVGGDGWVGAGVYGEGSNYGVYAYCYDSWGTNNYGVYVNAGSAGGAAGAINAYGVRSQVWRYGTGNYWSGYFYDSGSGGTYGGLYADVRTGGLIDLAEYILDTKGDTEAGDVLAADPDNDESVIKSSIPYDSTVVGIVSTQPHMLMGMELVMDEETGEMYEDVDAAMLALAGRVPVKVTDENGPIERGDLLTTSSKSGYAMKWTLLDVNQAADFNELKSILAENETRRNAVVGKALGNLDSGDGKIVALVNLQ